MKSKRLLSILTAAAILVSLTGCNTDSGSSGSSSDAGSSNSSQSTPADNSSDTPSDSGSESDAQTSTATGEGEGEGEGTEIDVEAYTAKSSEIYNNVLGEFHEYYQKAESASTVSERFALMAIAEAKLLEAGVFLPTSSNGGRYALGRLAPHTVTNILWGNDAYKYYRCMIATEFIKAEDRTAIKDMFKQTAGTGTFEQSLKDFLAEKGYTLKDDFQYVYTSDPTTWDIMATSQQPDSEPIVNTYDNLLEYDLEGVLQPALAESLPTVSEDGLTYTFKIRQGVKWVDSQGREVGEVKADDFVAGMQHMMDAKGGLEYLVQDIIVGATGYIKGEITDFSQVGVKAVDDYTLEYTLEKPTSFFTTMFGYNVFAPVCRSFYESKGGKFGADFDSSAADYTYGTSPDNIAYCGPFLITSATEKNSIVFEQNPTYYRIDEMNIKSMKWNYNDNSDVTKAYNDLKAGTLDNVGLNSSTLPTAREEGLFDEYSYVSSTDATTFNMFINLNRQAFANTNDPSQVISTKSEEEKARTNQAVQNLHFRRALCYSVDRAEYNAQANGEELKLNSLRNGFVPGNFVELAEAVTVDINGTATDFPAGTKYGVIVQAQLTADGSPIKCYDPTLDEGLGSSDGFDGWYNPDAAAAEIATAVEELKAEGLEISPDAPIHIELPFPINSEVYVNRANVIKQSIEGATGGNIVIDLLECPSTYEWSYAAFYGQYGYDMNFDIGDLSGWGPDYGDPATYLNTMLPDYAGYMAKCLGLF